MTTDHHHDKRVDKEALEQACLGLESSVKRYIRKYEKKRHPPDSIKQEALEAVQHACHLLRQLTFKRSSLWHGICQLSSRWKQEYLVELQQLSSSGEWLPILSRFFQHYIRLRDGKVLLTSGECRHDGDSSSSTKYKSRLKSLALQSDGYTQMYSAPRGYSGFGWDEFFQPSVGIQTRLVGALQKIARKNNVWDVLLEHGAQSFESALDMHEASTNRALSELELLRKTFCQDVLQVLQKQGGGTVQMVTLDKMERLQIVFGSKNSKTRMNLERLADNFKVKDKKGVLPNGWTQHEWSRAFKLPATIKTRTSSSSKDKQPLQKRRRIMDSDDDDSNEEETHQKEGGLKVQVCKKKETTSNEASLDAIKTRLGVDAAGLQASREVVEAEEKNVVTTEANEEINELLTDIAESRDKIKRLRRVLKRAVEKQDDEYEVWDARECLRESIMSLGSLLLSLHSTLDDDKQTSRGTHIEQAEQLFREAVSLVEQQEAAHEEFSKQTPLEESSMIQRNLLLLRGRAHTNLGISLLGQSQLVVKHKALLGKAIEELKKARTCAVTMREKACHDAKSERGHLETAIDNIRAQQLECLASRWLGSALWHQGHKMESKNVFESAAKMLSHTTASPSSDCHAELLQDEISLGVERYYACATLVEFASEALEKIPIASCADGKAGQDLISWAFWGYDFATNLSNLIHELTQHKISPISFSDLQSEHELLTTEQIASEIEGLKRWWEQKKARAAAGTFIPTREHGPDLPRSDLFSDGPLHSDDKVPRRSFVVTGGPLRRPTKKTKGIGVGTSSSGGWGRSRRSSSGAKSVRTSTGGFEEMSFGGTPFYQNRSSDGEEKQIQFRKWGDELLPQIPEKMGVKLCYPACAPEPPNIRSQ